LKDGAKRAQAGLTLILGGQLAIGAHLFGDLIDPGFIIKLAQRLFTPVFGKAAQPPNYRFVAVTLLTLQLQDFFQFFQC
jgi:hypothetical protein